MHITRAELSAAIAAAHARGIKVTGHLCSIGFTEAADLGIDNLEHGLFVDTEFSAGKQPDVCPDTKAAVAHLATLKVDGPEIQARSEEHTSELPSLMRISYAVFCLKKKNNIRYHNNHPPHDI